MKREAMMKVKVHHRVPQIHDSGILGNFVVFVNHNSSNQRGQTSGQGREKRKERPEGGGIKELPVQEARHESEERLLRKLGFNAERYHSREQLEHWYPMK